MAVGSKTGTTLYTKTAPSIVHQIDAQTSTNRSNQRIDELLLDNGEVEGWRGCNGKSVVHMVPAKQIEYENLRAAFTGEAA